MSSTRIRTTRLLHGASRRDLLKLSAAAIATVAAPSVLRAQAGEIVFASWGGSWEAAMREAWFKPFTQKTGIGVRTVSGNAYGRIQAMVEAGKTEWDVVEVLPDFQWIGAEKKLLEPIDFNLVDKTPIMAGADLVTPYSVPQVLFSRLIAYNKKLSPAPKSFADIFDTKKFPGKRAFYSKANGAFLEAALLADGVAPSALYPLDIERALKKLSTIRDDILFYETNAQAEQFVTDGQAVIGLIPDGRALSAQKNGAPIEIAYDLSFLTWSAMVVPKGAPRAKQAMEFLAYTLTPDAQAAIAKAYTYGPVVPKAFDMIPAERAAILSGGPQMKNAVIMGEKWWGANLAAATEKVNAWKLS
ncbi:ABC transporter substrate-binding protein [Bosea sp. 124]|uniref:ABC transporter substrate-binding protein n=1 Tax=Bosea sp. 124 TaxID=2135642 RepID=UPI000D4F4B68|nr:ABC transporter substrate-binding protein [Bosea sp. 124]PTM40031.1 putative spermidine/putrescine transport system substrate-binding protein [Bosea sp. 124]